jgi:hypothetical protein
VDGLLSVLLDLPGRAHTRRVEAAINREIAKESRRLKQRAAKKRQAAKAKRGSRRAAA